MSNCRLINIFLLVLTCFITLFADAKSIYPITNLEQTPWSPYLLTTVDRNDGSLIDVYIIKSTGENKPTLIGLQGSHCLPLFMMNEKRRVSPLMFQSELERASNQANIIVIEKRGLKSFGPPPSTEEEANVLAKCTELHGGVTKDTRVSDVVRVIKALSKTKWSGPIHIVGHSEGADVATGVVRSLNGKIVKSIGLMSGAGNTRFFEYLSIARNQAGALGVAQVLNEQIKITSNNPPVEYRGAPVSRDITYAIDSSPLDDVKGLRIPIFVASVDRDSHSSIAGAEVFVSELLRDKKQKIHYLMLPGLDHGYFTADGKDESGPVFSYYLNWIVNGVFDRSIKVGL